MKRIFDKIYAFELVGQSYSFAIKHGATTLRLVCVYLLLYVFGGLFLSQLLGGDTVLFSWSEWLLSNAILGWALFTIARIVYFNETLQTIDVSDIFTVDRIKCSVKAVSFFVLFMCLMKVSNSFLFEIFDEPTRVKENFWSILLLGYFSIMLFLSSYIATAPAVRARSYTFFYMIFHPTYLLKIAIIWLGTFAPFYLALYGHAYFDYYQTGNDLIVSHLQARDSFVDFLLVGSVRIIAFILFSIGFIKTTTHYIVPDSAFVMRKFKDKEGDGDEVQAITHQPHRDEQGNVIDPNSTVDDLEKTEQNNDKSQEIIPPDQNKG